MNTECVQLWAIRLLKHSLFWSCWHISEQNWLEDLLEGTFPHIYHTLYTVTCIWRANWERRYQIPVPEKKKIEQKSWIYESWWMDMRVQWAGTHVDHKFLYRYDQNKCTRAFTDATWRRSICCGCSALISSIVTAIITVDSKTQPRGRLCLKPVDFYYQLADQLSPFMPVFSDMPTISLVFSDDCLSTLD